MKRVLLFFSVLIFISACTQSGVPGDVLAPKEMKALLKDMHLTDAYISTLSDTLKAKELAKKYYAGIYKKYQIGQKDFERSLKYYATEPSLLDSMYKQIYEDLTQKAPVKLPKAVE